MEENVCLVTLGCSKNIYDSEVLLGQLKQVGINATHETYCKKKDFVIINTCGFISDAKEESINTILAYIKLKQIGEIKKVFAIGCMIQRYKADLKKEIPEVDGFFGLNEIHLLFKALQKKHIAEFENRQLSTPPHYAYLKIAEGCDRTCSFCAIPAIRGKYISKGIEKIVAEANVLVSGGSKELILIAQDTSYYGLDIYKKRTLEKLISELANIKNLHWLRLQYLYPTHFPVDILDIMNLNPKVCSYIDLPLQHINDKILTSMRRNISAYECKFLIEKIRRKVDNVALRTTIIVGYPGETEKDFQELLDFVKQTRFDRLGAFTYSHEEGTPAYKLKNNVPEKIKQQRLEELMSLQSQISLQINQAKVGKIVEVIIDRKEGDYFIGRSQHDSPEVDNEILLPATNSKIIIGNIYMAKITAAEEFDLFAEIVECYSV